MTLEEAQKILDAAGLHPPLLVKPLWTDGREGSHGLALLHDVEALGKILQGSISKELKPPLVVQQFVEHGGVLYKVYVLGLQTVVTRRPSLGDRHMRRNNSDVEQLPRISCQRHTGHSGGGGMQRHPYRLSCGEAVGGGEESTVDDYPPDWLTDALASHLRQQLGLQLFNFDLISPEEQGISDAVQYYIVDINYFPGVDKIPGFEQLFVDFLKATIEQQDSGWQQHSGESSSSCGS
jgi:inositol-1,3,4-trisphosphate 5/6-kinase/inositol-tetrakisphosphate 1-kinase